MKVNKKCICCGREYMYDASADPPYQYNFCDDECHMLFSIVSAYNAGDKSKKLRDKLNRMELSKDKEFIFYVKSTIGKIKKAPKQKKTNE